MPVPDPLLKKKAKDIGATAPMQTGNAGLQKLTGAVLYIRAEEEASNACHAPIWACLLDRMRSRTFCICICQAECGSAACVYALSVVQIDSCQRCKFTVVVE